MASAMTVPLALLSTGVAHADGNDDDFAQKANNVGIIAAPADLISNAHRAAPVDCSGPGYSGNPFDCQDKPGQGFICGGQGLTCGPTVDSSQLPSRMGPNGGQDWGHGLPCSTDPRFSGCPGASPDQNFLAAVTPRIGSPSGPQVLIQMGHAICSGLAKGSTYNQEAEKVLTASPQLTPDNAIFLVETSRQFYCPTL
ncbi:DUF732 domain-containing protein [Mycobacterium heidelbergense]|uniref:DUF732 domain-containing protein n=2 Tax=Mycobacterium heidelbergense TaxID=53376 RepID=UPI0009F595CE